MQMIQFDICTAFLNDKIDIELYIVQLLDFEVKQSLRLVCLILWSLYGFKQWGQIWNKTFNDFLIAIDLYPTEVDPCIYVTRNEPIMIITLFVDDGLASYASPACLEEFVCHIEKHFVVTQSSADLYVGMYIKCDQGRKLLYVNQSLYL